MIGREGSDGLVSQDEHLFLWNMLTNEKYLDRGAYLTHHLLCVATSTQFGDIVIGCLVTRIAKHLVHKGDLTSLMPVF